MNEEGFHTPSGAAFNASTTRLVWKNPIYCTADKRSYDYFIDHDGNVFGDMIEFDGTHGLSAYNKTDQEKYEGSDSTFISPKYVQTIESKPVSEWIIAVGRHEGFIPSEQWIEVQELLDAIAVKYNRPHRKTNALLAGLAHCPHCGRRLSVISESDRWTNGKPRFKYVCPGYRKKECNFKAVNGVLLDEFVVQQLSELSDENSERFRRILEIKIEEVLEQSQTVQEHNLIKKKRDKLKADIAAQTRNLREADGSIKQFIQEDLQNLAEELREAERQLSKLDEGRKNNMIAIRDLEMTKERLLSFAEYAKDAQPEVLVTLIQTIVERIYIVDKDDERYCHIFIKGCSGEDYTGFFQTAGYIEQKTTPVCDSEQYCITDIVRRNTYLIGQRRECVPQLVQYDFRQVVVRKELAKQLGQIIRPERLAVLHHDHIVVIVVGVLVFCPARLLMLLRRLQHIAQRIRQIKRARRGRRFGAILDFLFTSLRARILNRDGLVFKVNIVPPQTAQLAAAQSEIRADKHRQLEPRSDSLGEQNTKLLRRVELRLALTLFRRRDRTHRIFRDVLLPLRRVQRVRQQIMMLDDRMPSSPRSAAG